MLHDLMRFSFFPCPVSVLLSHFWSVFPPLCLSFRYALPSRDNGWLCIIEITVDNGTANWQQKYIDEPVSEVNLLLHIQSFQWLSVYILSMDGLVYFNQSSVIFTPFLLQYSCCFFKLQMWRWMDGKWRINRQIASL